MELESEYKIVNRGYVENDKKEFSKQAFELLHRAGEELYYLVNRGYDVKNSSTFIGNHYMLSERQRLALVRIISSYKDLEKRKEKELKQLQSNCMVHIDGFNTIITLEVALSNSLLIRGMDGTIRDLAGLRGTYRIIDKTQKAIYLILKALQKNNIATTYIYLDAPISNSGRLRSLILQLAECISFSVVVKVIPNVDSILEQLDCVITSDAIILNRCISWFNLNSFILEKDIKNYWCFDLLMQR